MKKLLSSIHLDYLLNDFSCNQNRFDYLFPLLEAVNAYERRWFFPTRYECESSGPDVEFFEERLEREFMEFKSELLGRVEMGMRECSVVFGYLAETLNVLRRLGCPVAAQAREVSLRTTLHAVHDLEDQTLEATRRLSLEAKLEEIIANHYANTELFRGRYELFCSQVVGRLIPKSSASMDSFDRFA